MSSILKKIETPYVDAQTLLNLLVGYQRPRERILLMVKNKELIRLKNGFYLITDKVTQNGRTVVPYEQVANLLYGPSYVSLEWALSFYGIIPERVHTITSMTSGRDKEYQTPIGHFTYFKLSEDSYSIGITQKPSIDFVGNFLMATAEKALIDWVFKTCRDFNKEQLKVELLESKRIDPNIFKNLDRALFYDIAKTYKSKSVNELINLMGLL